MYDYLLSPDQTIIHLTIQFEIETMNFLDIMNHEKLDFQKAVDILFSRVCYHSSQRLSTKIYKDMEFKNDKLASDS